jgi:hypothetical protein
MQLRETAVQRTWWGKRVGTVSKEAQVSQQESGTLPKKAQKEPFK